MDELELFYAILLLLGNNNLSAFAISNAINVIHQCYSIKHINTVTASRIDYNQLVYRCAYIYLYLTSHVYVVYNLLSTFWECNEIKARVAKWRGSVTVCSIGGGPGSDIFGLNLFLKKFKGSVNISGVILDHCESWKNTFNDLKSALKIQNMGGVQYRKFEFFMDSDDTNTKLAIANADVVTLVKFVSAVGHDRDDAENRITNLLQYVRPGGIVLFIDNGGGGYLELVQRSAMRANLQRIRHVVRQHFIIPDGESTIIDSNNRGIRGNPQKSTTVSASIWFKEDTYQLSNGRISNTRYNTGNNRNQNVSARVTTTNANRNQTTVSVSNITVRQKTVLTPKRPAPTTQHPSSISNRQSSAYSGSDVHVQPPQNYYSDRYYQYSYARPTDDYNRNTAVTSYPRDWSTRSNYSATTRPVPHQNYHSTIAPRSSQESDDGDNCCGCIIL